MYNSTTQTTPKPVRAAAPAPSDAGNPLFPLTPSQVRDLLGLSLAARKHHPMILYGISTCPDCNRAHKTFNEAGIDITFRDVRAEPMSEQEWEALLAEFGDNLVDRKSQTFRNLNAWMRESEADAQLADTPALMARPVITDGTRYTLGWNDDAKSAWL